MLFQFFFSFLFCYCWTRCERKNQLNIILTFFQTFSGFIPGLVRKTKIVKRLSRMLVNHLGLTLTKEDLQNVVDLMEPYGQISNGIELLNPPLDVRFYSS